MASGTVTPGAPAPAATPSPTPAPASAPAAAPSTPAPAAAPSLATDQTLSIGDRIRQGWENHVDNFKPEGDEPPAADPNPPSGEDNPAPDPVPDPAADPNPDDPQPDADKKPDENNPQPGDEPALLIDDAEALTPQGLAKALKDNPEVEKFFSDNPEIKNQVFAALRRDNETREIRQIFPTTEIAREAASGHALMQNYDTKFLSATTKEGVQDFMDFWVQQSLIVDDAGKPKLDAQGKYQVEPALMNILDTVFENRLNVLTNSAKTKGNERLQAALDIIREETSPHSPDAGDVPDELKGYADSLKAERAAIDKEKADAARQRQEQAKAANLQSIDRAETKAAESVQGQLKPLFAKASLSEFESSAALEKIGASVDEKLEANATFRAVRDQILSRPPSDEREKALTRHLLSYVQEYIGPIAAQVIREAKGGALNRQSAAAEKKAAQAADSRTEPKGASLTPAQPRTTSPTELHAQITKEYMDAHNGDRPSMDYLVKEGMKRMSAPRR